MELATTCYYTWSTISQTLAGAFGIVVPVVLYRIQGIENRLPDILAGITGAAKSLADASTEEQRHSPEYKEEIRAIFAPMYIHQEQLESARKALVLSLRWTIGTILTCLVLLILTPVLAPFVEFAWICLAATAVLAAFCFLKYVDLVRKAMTTPVHGRAAIKSHSTMIASGSITPPGEPGRDPSPS